MTTPKIPQNASPNELVTHCELLIYSDKASIEDLKEALERTTSLILKQVIKAKQ